ncbi:MAG TPA: hypothetical protein VEA37_15125, partial [Flavobacterium sp.]|nr:hypothetical protein [Flavobacterium sp.]
MHEKTLPCRKGNVSRKCFGVLFFLAFLLAGNYGYSQVGTTCENPIVIPALPYTTTDDTANYADNYDPDVDASPVCASAGDNGNHYHSGNDVIYSYTPATDTSIDIEMPDGVAWSAMFVYTDCADIGIEYAACAAGTSTGDRVIDNFPVEGGETYYILLSIWATPQTFAYTLNITENTCIEHTVVFDIVPDCENGAQFFITANVTDMGSATAIAFTDDQGSASQQLSATGTVTFGPYDNLTEVVLTAANTADGSCVVVSEELTMIGCPPANDECSGAIALTVNTSAECTAVTAGTTAG